MDAAASLNPLAITRFHYPVRGAAAPEKVAGHADDSTRQGSAASGQRAQSTEPSLTSPAHQERAHSGFHSHDGPLRRESYGYTAQVAIRSYYVAAAADVDIHRVDTYA